MDSRHDRQADIQLIVLSYDAPAVESVLSQAELEREILYAGGLTFPWTDIPD